jgi:hypothetical protein
MMTKKNRPYVQGCYKWTDWDGTFSYTNPYLIYEPPAASTIGLYTKPYLRDSVWLRVLLFDNVRLNTGANPFHSPYTQTRGVGFVVKANLIVIIWDIKGSLTNMVPEGDFWKKIQKRKVCLSL